MRRRRHNDYYDEGPRGRSHPILALLVVLSIVSALAWLILGTGAADQVTAWVNSAKSINLEDMGVKEMAAGLMTFGIVAAIALMLLDDL